MDRNSTSNRQAHASLMGRGQRRRWLPNSGKLLACVATCLGCGGRTPMFDGRAKGRDALPPVEGTGGVSGAHGFNGSSGAMPAVSTGGTLGSGGAVGTGGTTSTGGVIGTTGTGGTTHTGGTVSSGGTVSTGGATQRSTDWVTIASPFPEQEPCDYWCGMTPSFNDVWCADASQLWVVANTASYKAPSSEGIWILGEGTWQQAPGPAFQWISSISGSGAEDVWVGGTAMTSDPMYASRWDGETWQRPAEPSGSLVWVNDSKDIWLCCEELPDADPRQLVAHHWDGRAWTGSPLPAGSAWPRVLWSRSASQAWLVTDAEGALHFDGRAWSILPGSEGTVFRNGWSTSDVETWLVARSGEVFRWDGAWHAVSFPLELGESPSFTAGWGTSPANVWLVGFYGLVAHWNGRTWTSEASGTDQTLHDIWGLASGHLWVVGDSGFLAHREF